MNIHMSIEIGDCHWLCLLSSGVVTVRYGTLHVGCHTAAGIGTDGGLLSLNMYEERLLICCQTIHIHVEIT